MNTVLKDGIILVTRREILKNQYFGDRNDLFKYDLLIHLASSLPQIDRLTFIAMLTLDDSSTDGGLVDYPRGESDPDLYCYLRNCLENGWRDLYLLRGFFAANPKSFQYSPWCDKEEFRHEARGEYFAGIPEEYMRSALIFLDPDNGLEVKSSRPGNFEKYVRYSEVADFCARMGDDSVLVIYQHLPRIERPKIFEQLSDKLVEACSCLPPLFVTDGAIAFISILKDSERRQWLARSAGEYRDRNPKVAIYDSLATS